MRCVASAGAGCVSSVGTLAIVYSPGGGTDLGWQPAGHRGLGGRAPRGGGRTLGPRTGGPELDRAVGASVGWTRRDATGGGEARRWLRGTRQYSNLRVWGAAKGPTEGGEGQGSVGGSWGEAPGVGGLVRSRVRGRACAWFRSRSGRPGAGPANQRVSSPSIGGETGESLEKPSTATAPALVRRPPALPLLPVTWPPCPRPCPFRPPRAIKPPPVLTPSSASPARPSLRHTLPSPFPIMAVGPAATSVSAEGFQHLVDPNRKWYNNRRSVPGFLSTRPASLTPSFLQTHHPPRMACPPVSPPSPATRHCSCSPRSLVLFSLITSSTNGFDGSLMNSLQSMDQWENFFNKPEGGTLGLLNAIQVRHRRLLPLTIPRPPSHTPSPTRTSVPSPATPSPPTSPTASAASPPSGSAPSA